MIKYSFEQTKVLVTAYLNGEGGIRTVIKKYGYSNRSQLQRWIVAYQMYGDDGMTMVTGRWLTMCPYWLDMCPL